MQKSRDGQRSFAILLDVLHQAVGMDVDDGHCRVGAMLSQADGAILEHKAGLDRT